MNCGLKWVLDTFGASRKSSLSKGGLFHNLNWLTLKLVPPLESLWYIHCISILKYFSHFRWYFGKIKRIEAEKKLLLQQNEHGAFLIRDSESRRNDFSLSVRDGDTVKHYRIRWALFFCLLVKQNSRAFAPVIIHEPSPLKWVGIMKIMAPMQLTMTVVDPP